MCAKTLKGGFFYQPTLAKKISVVKKILLGVLNEAVLLRSTKAHLNIKRSMNFFDTPCREFRLTMYFVSRLAKTFQALVPNMRLPKKKLQALVGDTQFKSPSRLLPSVPAFADILDGRLN